jgi:Carbohydrate binding domain.
MSKLKPSRLSPFICRGLLAVVPLALAGCSADNPGSKEIFIEAVPNSSDQFTSSFYGDQKSGSSQPILLDFDDDPYLVTPSKSLLYRGEYLGYVRDQGHFKPGALLVSNRTAPWHGPLVILPALENGRVYSASVWVKLIETDFPARAKLVWSQVVGGAFTELALAEMDVEPRVWVKLEGEFIGNAQPESTINALGLEVDKVDVKYLVDDFMVVYAELSAELQARAVEAKSKVMDLIVNGDVEQGLEPWTHQGGVITRSSAYANTGSYSLLISGRQREWNAPMIPVKGMENNKLYRFSVFARMNDGEPATNLKLTMRRTTAGQTTFVSLGTGQATSTTWSEVSGTFSAGNIAESEQVTVYLEAESPTASYFVDTLTVEVVPGS